VDLLAFDKQFCHYTHFAGIDEAGRGPLAGPVVAAAVILPQALNHDFSINDSKKLSAAKREQAFELIYEIAISIGIGIVSHQDIDAINIYQASLKAMQIAVAELKPSPDYVLVDGRAVPDLDMPAQAVIKGDSKSLSIAAASIVAKVTRDRMMVDLNEKYPQYEFARHKGYPTRLHIARIAEYGLCPVHRRSFKPKQLSYLYEQD